MKKFILSCCSTVDLNKEYLSKRDIKYISFHYELNGKDYLDDFGESMKLQDLYKAMSEGKDTKTSMVSTGEYIEFFRTFLKEGKDILHVSLSSGLSGTYNSAIIARDMLKDEFSDRKIYIVDSLAASSGYGLFVDTLATLRDEDYDIDSLYKYAEDNKLYLNHYFFSTDLSFYIKGGRVTKTAGFVGTLLNICPLLYVDNSGHLIPKEKVRSKRKVINRIVDLMEEKALEGLNYSDKCFISHSNCYEDASTVANLIESKFHKLNGRVQIFDIGATIGSHTGPGTVALFFYGKKRQ